MLTQALSIFGLSANYNLDVMCDNQTLPNLTSNIINGVSTIITQSEPDVVLVHGDTTSTLGAALAAYYAKIPVAHVEAGLRTHDIYSPWPEEINRRLTDAIADRHFAPTASARKNLLGEGIASDSIVVTGNTVIDALFDSLQGPLSSAGKKESIERAWPFARTSKRIVLVTGHRRESFGEGFEGICTGLARLAERDDIHIVYPVHLNPNVQAPVHRHLADLENVTLMKPLDYLPFVHLMSKCDVVLTDSGGIQEEAPSLGKPVFVMRAVTERPEAVAAGTVRLVGTDPDRIVAEVSRVLDDPAEYEAMRGVHNPYGDGHASMHVLNVLKGYA